MIMNLNFTIIILTNKIKHTRIQTCANLNNFYLTRYFKKYFVFGKSGFLKGKKINGNKIKGIAWILIRDANLIWTWWIETDLNGCKFFKSYLMGNG